MKDRIIAASLLVIAIIHLMPIIGFFGTEQLLALYGVEISDTSLEILMRHRAVLFGLLGCFFGYAAFRPVLRPLAFLAAAGSIASFFYLALTVGEYNDAIGRVIIADVVAAIALVIAVVLTFLSRDVSS